MKHEDREIRKRLRKMGYDRDRRLGCGHFRFDHPCGAWLIVPSSIGKGRAFQNLMAKARRRIREAEGKQRAAR